MTQNLILQYLNINASQNFGKYVQQALMLENLLTPMGHLELAKYALNAISSYTMLYFKISKKIATPWIIRCYFGFYIHYFDWDRIIQPKENGGINIIDAYTKRSFAPY